MIENEEIQNKAMTMISFSGMAKDNAFAAIKCAKRFDFAGAENAFTEYHGNIKKAQQAHTDMLQMDAKGEVDGLDMLLAHALDQFMSAMSVYDLAVEIVDVYRAVHNMKNIEG